MQERKISVSADPLATPRGIAGRAPDVFHRGRWIPMMSYKDSEAVDFVIVGTGAGGGPLIARLAEMGYSVVGFDAGAWFRPLEDFASDETSQNQLFWTDDRLVTGENPIVMGKNNSGKAVGGSTVHYSMVSLRFRPDWFLSRSKLGYGADWPVTWQEMWHYYDQVERDLAIAGPLTYPWGPKRPRYPYRAHELNAAGEILAKGAEAMGYAWAETPLATLSAPRGHAPSCVYRGFCRVGCSTNAKQSQLVTYIPRGVKAGAEIRDLAMVGRVELDANDRACGVHYFRNGQWQFQRAKNVIVAGYAIETPRLLLNSATARFPNGLANRSGLVGKYLMVQSNQAVFGKADELIRWNKGPPSMTITEHWNYDDRKDFFGGYCWMSQGPLPVEWSGALSSGRKIWGDALQKEMSTYNHTVGLKMVGEMMPSLENCVTLSDARDQYGLQIPLITYSWLDNDKMMIQHALQKMQESLESAGVHDCWRQENDTNHLAGTARMGFNPSESVVDGDCRSWDIPNLWICDGSVFPTTGGVNPSLTISALALRTADRICELHRQGKLKF